MRGYRDEALGILNDPGSVHFCQYFVIFAFYFVIFILLRHLFCHLFLRFILSFYFCVLFSHFLLNAHAVALLLFGYLHFKHYTIILQ